MEQHTPSAERPAAGQYLNPLDLYSKGAAGRRCSRDRIALLPWEEEEDGLDFARKTLSDTAMLQPPQQAVCGRRSYHAGATPEVTEHGGGVRRNSQQAFAEKMHTSLVLDWDDTLFPTTWVREDCRLDWRYQLEEQLEAGERLDAIHGLLCKHLVRVEEFLFEAAAHANIFIVTLARRPWVENSMEKFLPGLDRIIKEHALKVIYAQEFADEKEVTEYIQEGSKTPEEGTAFWTRVKADAIARELDAFHRLVGASWKNVISFGDSDFERYGTLTAGQDYMRREMEGGSVVQTGHTAEGVSKDGHFKRLRVKTVKMLDKPTVLELTAELALLRRWLPHIVRRDAGFDLEIDSTDDDVRLGELHRLVTGEEDAALSWHDLAGMKDER